MNDKEKVLEELKKVLAELKFAENMKQLEKQANIETIKQSILEEIAVLRNRIKSVEDQYSKLSKHAAKEKKQLEKYAAEFKTQIKELEKRYEIYDNQK